MEKLKSELEQAIMDRFKYSQIVHGIENKIKKHTESIIFKKYQNTKIKRGQWTFELAGVQCENSSNERDIQIEDIYTQLIYFNISKLNTKQKTVLKNIIKRYDIDKYLDWYDENKLQAKLYVIECYNLTFEDVLKKNLNLNIEGKTI